MTGTDYRAVFAEIPDLAAQLAGAIIPTPPTRGERIQSSTRGEAARVKAIDDLNRVMSFLANQADLWMPVLAALEYDKPEPVRELEVADGRYRKVVSDDPLIAWRDANKIVAWLLTEWEDIGGHPLFYMFTDAIDDRPYVDADLPHDSSIVQLVHRLEVRKQEQTPADCHKCFARDVWADLEHSSGVCASCGHVHRPDIWMTVAEVAKQLEVAKKTVHEWINENAVEWRMEKPLGGSKLVRQVELKSCQQHHELSMARRVLNLTRK